MMFSNFGLRNGLRELGDERHGASDSAMASTLEEPMDPIGVIRFVHSTVGFMH